MSKTFSNVVVITLMLIAFVGKAFAYTAMSCEMSASSHGSHMTMDHSQMTHHEGMGHSEMKTSNNAQNGDCCEVDCACPTNACTSLTMLNSRIDSTDFQLLSESVAALQSEQPISITSPFYRPPIFA